MDRLFKILFLFLLIFIRAILIHGLRNKNHSPPNITLPLLNNVTSIALIPKSFHSNDEKFPLFNPCYNPFSNNDLATHPVDPYWLKGGEFHISTFKNALFKYHLSEKEHEWLSLQVVPRLTFLWSLYELANNIHMIDTSKWQISLKHSLAHSLIRIIGYQKLYELTLQAHYWVHNKLVASQELNSIHVLILYTFDKSFIPLLIFNPPQHLLGSKAQGELIPRFWDEITQDPHTLIGDPKQNLVFAPYQHYSNAFNFTQVKTIGIFSSFGQFTIPAFASPSITALIKQALKEFQEACMVFAQIEEARFLNRMAPPPLRQLKLEP
jgi:hypothetical protein